MEGLNGKIVVFAGAGGIGNATAGFLGKGGAKVVIGDIRQSSADACVKAAKDAGGDGAATVLDIADEQSVKNLIDLAIRTYGRCECGFTRACDDEKHPVKYPSGNGRNGDCNDARTAARQTGRHWSDGSISLFRSFWMDYGAIVMR